MYLEWESSVIFLEKETGYNILCVKKKSENDESSNAELVRKPVEESGILKTNWSIKESFIYWLHFYC